MKTIIISCFALLIGFASMAQGPVKKAASSTAIVPAGIYADYGYPNSAYKIRYVEGKLDLFPHGSVFIRNNDRPQMMPKIRIVKYEMGNKKTN